MREWVLVTKTEEIPLGQTRSFCVREKEICISHVKGTFYAFINQCSHMDFPLVDGNLEDSVIECAHHGAKFDITTGAVVCMPAITPIEIYPLKVQENEIFIQL
ncbi:MAG: non-heme iron oxygenase ferredoxin subunit [Deltaproteobacteria bacterium]|nr:non-heme iron oxygenase ferredoxin subunit [Deltaproteobacteria bacterium]